MAEDYRVFIVVYSNGKVGLYNGLKQTCYLIGEWEKSSTGIFAVSITEE